MRNLRCWLFGHEWLHLDTAMLPESDGRELYSGHICDRCDAERQVNFDAWYLEDERGESDDVEHPLPEFEDLIEEDGDRDE